MTVTKQEKLAELCDAKSKLCSFCDNTEDCSKCQVTQLINDAFACCSDYDD